MHAVWTTIDWCKFGARFFFGFRDRFAAHLIVGLFFFYPPRDWLANSWNSVRFLMNVMSGNKSKSGRPWIDRSALRPLIDRRVEQSTDCFESDQGGGDG